MSRQKELAIKSARVLREAGHVVYFAAALFRLLFEQEILVRGKIVVNLCFS
jgi:hypothetical protein